MIVGLVAQWIEQFRPKEKVVRLVRECQEKGVVWGLQTDNTKTRLVPDERFQAMTNDLYMESRIVPGLDPEDYPELFKVYVACSHDEELQIKSLRDMPHYRFFKEYLFVEFIITPHFLVSILI